VSIVCVTHGRREHVVRCLESCEAQDYPRLETIVVVNPSGDGTEAAIAARFPSVRLIRTPRNIGFFPGLNLGIANASGDYVMTVDDDAYFLSRSAIAELAGALGRDPTLGAVTCSLEGPTETPADGDRYVHLFTTGFTMLPRRAFTEWVGYYPDLFFRSAGETYMCTALWDAGLRVKRLARVRMYHARTPQARPDVEFRFHALRSQVLCALMRDPWYLLAPSLASKAARSLLAHARAGQLGTWARAWASAVAHAPAALGLRRPISWKTQRLIWRLRREVVSDLGRPRTAPRLHGAVE
jgi:GT2 family glycosyltransferase